MVELDQVRLGARIQGLLGDTTGRRTVPNVLINGVSIGGGDEVAGLDTAHALMDKVQELRGNKKLTIKLRPIADDSHGLR